MAARSIELKMHSSGEIREQAEILLYLLEGNAPERVLETQLENLNRVVPMQKTMEDEEIDIVN